jgi:alkylation response protein AidB-like acyl-CoA dehydrogenase
MRLSLTSEELEIRSEVRAFLSEHQPAAGALPEDFDERIAFLRDWQRRLNEAGLVNIAWPAEHGGRGATMGEQLVVSHELAIAGAPELIGVVGLDVVGPSIVEYGTTEQKAAFIPSILSAQEIWCQGFSEPEAGSDLAALRSRAEDRGSHFVLNGQKTWTSWAQYARWCAVLARTDPEARPHRGISYLIVDMSSPGVTVRPLTQITGDAEFSEVYFDDVRVPADMILGARNAGWGIAMHTLSHERGPAVAARAVKLRVLLDGLLVDAGRVMRNGRPAIEDPAVRHALTRAHVELEVLRHHSHRSIGAAAARGKPGVESSIDKLFMSVAEQRLGAACLAVMGPFTSRSGAGSAGADIGGLQSAYLYGRAASIYGGTAQIQKNIIAERILDLPRSG